MQLTSGERVRAIVGARVSVMTGKSKVSHVIQQETGQRHVEQAGWEVVGSFEDLDVSASVSPWNRPDLGPWLTDRATEWDALIFAKVDRAFRSAKDCADLAHWAEQNRKIMVFTDDGITLDFRRNADSFATMMSKVFLMLASLFAEMELRRIKNRAQAAHKYLRGQDRWPGGQPPYGFKVVPRPKGGKTLAIDPVSSAIVRCAATLLLEGKSLWEIASVLTEKGHATPAQYVASQQDVEGRTKRKNPPSTRWNPSSVGKILRSPATMGYKCIGAGVTNRRVARGPDGHPIRMADPIFTNEYWSQIQGALDKRAVKRERTHRAAPLLGIVYCGGCRNRLYRRVTSNKSGEYSYYSCARTLGRKACRKHCFRSDRLQQLLDTHVPIELRDIPVTVRQFVPGEDHTERLEAVTQAMEDIRGEKDAGLYDYQGGSDDYSRRLASLVSQRRALETRPQRAPGWIEKPTGETYAEAYARMTPDQRRDLLLNAGIRAYLTPYSFQLIVPDDVKERASLSNAVQLQTAS